MNKSAREHLDKAKGFVAKGEEFYRKAAEAIVAAQKADSTISNREIGESLGRSKWWVADIVRAYTTGEGLTTPWASDTPRRTADAAKKVLRDAEPEQLTELMRDLPPERRAAVVRAAVPPPDRVERTPAGPSFIDLIVRVSTALIELEAMVAGWQNRAALPGEFSRESFNDIAAKVLRIQDAFDSIADTAGDDEFLEIVRNFRVTTDVR